MSTTARTDIYTRVTDRIIADLEKGVRPWMKPWNADHPAGRIQPPSAPQRHTLQRRQHPAVVGSSPGQRLRLEYLDDL